VITQAELREIYRLKKTLRRLGREYEEKVRSLAEALRAGVAVRPGLFTAEFAKKTVPVLDDELGWIGEEVEVLEVE
jgi:hypothetical protein